MAAKERAVAESRAAAAAAVPTNLDNDLFGTSADGFESPQSDILTELELDAEQSTSLAISEKPDGFAQPTASAALDGPTCPSCQRSLPKNAKFCVQCGINVKTGRSIITSDDGHVDNAYISAERIISAISWVISFGCYPIASEAFGTRKPHMIRAIAILTTLISVWFLCIEMSGSTKMQSCKQLLLWTGEQKPTADRIETFYRYTYYGDDAAFKREYQKLEDQAETLTESERIIKAHEALPLEQRSIGEYRTSQLLTNAFLHAGIIHLAGNLVFLMIFGSRVNMLIGNIATAILYPLLAVGASFIFYVSAADEQPLPCLGASGAIMGLAGMYLVLFPVHKVHMAVWLRLGFIRMFRLSLKLFAIRGFWVVLFYIAFDIAFSILGWNTGTAHWAHLGGFIVGVVLALALLLTRFINARGGDILSVILGKYAWALVGKPRA